MRWGCCTTVDNAELLGQIGYDFIELTMVSLADDEQYKQIQDTLSGLHLGVEAFNVLLPGEIKVVGPEVNWDGLREYLDLVLPRAAALGGKVVVFGSGRSRRVPEGFAPEEARRQVLEFARHLGEQATSLGLAIGLEPLRPAECNLLNHVSTAFQWVQEAELTEVGITADFYHMTEGDEPLSNIVDAASKVVHVHLADTGRMWPGSGNYDYPGFFGSVKVAGYDGRMSLECGWDDFPSNATSALAFLRETWENA